MSTVLMSHYLTHNNVYTSPDHVTLSAVNITVSNVENATVTSQNREIFLLNETEYYLWRCVSPVLLLLGVLGNILNIIVVWRMKFWRKTPLFLLAVLAVTDITVLIDGLLYYWVKFTFDVNFRLLSSASCKVNLFVIYFSMQFSSWILVCMSVDRFLKTNFPFRYIRIITINKTIVTVVIIFIILTGVNLHFFWTNALVDGECTDIKEEYFKFEEEVFVFIDFAFLSVIPFLLMAILNYFIYRALQQQVTFHRASVVGSTRHRRRDNRRQFSRKLTRMLLFVSCYFLVSTLPISVYFIYDSYKTIDDDLKDARKSVAWTVMYLLQYSNYSLNFIWYAAHNKVFREKMKEVLGFKQKGFRYRNTTRRNNRQSSSHMTTSLNNSFDDVISETHGNEYSEDVPSVDNSTVTTAASSNVTLDTYQHM